MHQFSAGCPNQGPMHNVGLPHHAVHPLCVTASHTRLTEGKQPLSTSRALVLYTNTFFMTCTSARHCGHPPSFADPDTAGTAGLLAPPTHMEQPSQPATHAINVPARHNPPKSQIAPLTPLRAVQPLVQLRDAASRRVYGREAGTNCDPGTPDAAFRAGTSFFTSPHVLQP